MTRRKPSKRSSTKSPRRVFTASSESGRGESEKHRAKDRDHHEGRAHGRRRDGPRKGSKRKAGKAYRYYAPDEASSVSSASVASSATVASGPLLGTIRLGLPTNFTKVPKVLRSDAAQGFIFRLTEKSRLARALQEWIYAFHDYRGVPKPVSEMHSKERKRFLAKHEGEDRHGGRKSRRRRD